LDFSARNRPHILEKLKRETFDVLVIGGGITGAGIALDAASRGLKVALVEKNDFAFGTSSRSTKLIHGGLRYLKQLEFGLVKEVGSERAVVHRLAPHLVVPEKMLLPLHEKRGLGYWLTSIGLKIYDWLAGVRPEDQRRMLTRSQTLKAEPLLKPEGIKGGALYAEYRTDDARLTIEIVKAAVKHDAIAINYVKALSFKTNANGILTAAIVSDVLTDSTFNISATVIVNAAGPWVDELRSVNNSLFGKRLHLTKGVHIVVPFEKLPVKQAIYFDVDDGRMIFAIPRGRTTYVGTTDTNYTGSKEEVLTSREDADYLVNAVNAMFPMVRLQVSDIESSWAGLRPLIHEDGKSASELSRKDEIFESPSGLISIAGGKLTGYRRMAERVVNLVCEKHFRDRTLVSCRTADIPVEGAGFANASELDLFTGKVIQELTKEGVPGHSALALIESFGSQCSSILNDFMKLQQITNPQLRLVIAVLQFCLEREMVTTANDFLIRRTGLLYFDIEIVRQTKEAVVEMMSEHLVWDNKRVVKELEEVELALLQTQAKHLLPK
jgi:glycerol-3-phosphate dehydrogenase